MFNVDFSKLWEAFKAKPYLLAFVLIMLMLIIKLPDILEQWVKKAGTPLPPPPDEVQDNKKYFTGESGVTYYAWHNDNPGINYKALGFTYFIPNNVDSLKCFFKYRADAYSRAIIQICREDLPFYLNEQVVMGFIGEENARHKESIIHKALDKIFIQVYDSVGYDAQSDRFICKLGIAYAKRAEAFMQNELTSLIMDALKREVHYQQWMDDPMGTELDFGVLLFALEHNKEFMKDYETLLEQFHDRLRILRLSVAENKGKYSAFFDSGDFRLNPISMFIISLIAEQYAAKVRNYPQSRFRILANGFGDGPAVGGIIPYGRNGKWSSAGDTLPLDGRQGDNIGPTFALGNKGNRQLSYARSFEAMYYLQTVMQFSYAETLEKVQLAYSGGHIGKGGSNPYERRVSFIIQELK